MQCEYAATMANNLQKHVESKHEGVRYSCFQCEYAATTANSLHKHVERKHEGVIYSCLQCKYAATILVRMLQLNQAV